MLRSLTNIVKDVAEITVKPIVTSVEVVTAPLAGIAKVVNETQGEIADDMRKGFGE